VVVRPGERTSNASLNRDLLLLSASLNRLVALGRLGSNPMGRMGWLPERRAARVVLTKEEIGALLEACGPWLRPFVLAGIYTGARAGELSRLTWGDIHFERGEITLVRSKTRTVAQVPMHSVLAGELRRLRGERGAVGRGDPAFLTRWGNRMRYYATAWKLALRRAGLLGRKGLVFHSLRHSFATHFLENGAAITDLQGLLGHASVTTTQIYAQMVNPRARKSLEALRFGA